MKGKHQSDLAWRFLHAKVDVSYVPSATLVLARVCEMGGFQSGGTPAARITEAQLASRDRASRIDAILERLPAGPLPYSRILRLRYGFEEEVRVLQQVLPNISGVAMLSPAAERWHEKLNGKPARPRSKDVRAMLESICIRVSVRKATPADERALAQIRIDAERILVEAEERYEALADRYDRRSRQWAA